MTLHHFTVDVEEYFQVSAFAHVVPRSRWDTCESRVESAVDGLLALLARHDVRGTFFVLGWLASRYPHMVTAIAAPGHEVASHGWDHRRVFEQTPEEFRTSVRRSKQVLEDIAQSPVRGFRAPSFSIQPGMEWALDILIDEGYRYDSSLFPVSRKGYGYPNGKRDPHRLRRTGGTLTEVPPATVRVAGINLPAGGGAYFRLLPYGLTRSALRDCEQRGVPGTFYIHPWELDPEQPRLPVSWQTKIRHYGGLRRTARRLERLMEEFRFQPIAATLDKQAP